MSNQLICVANDKGGIGKSLTAAMLVEELADSMPTTLVEIEARHSMTQRLYRHPPGVELKTIPLFHAADDGIPDASGKNLTELLQLIPPPGAPARRLILDCGASAFQTFWLWGKSRRGLKPFVDAGFKFVFFIPVLDQDDEAADFFNETAPALLKWGKVVVVLNEREGRNFSQLDSALLSSVHKISFLYRGRPLVGELILRAETGESDQRERRRFTFRQVASMPTASRRARLDAADCHRHFSEQLNQLRPTLGI